MASFLEIGSIVATPQIFLLIPSIPFIAQGIRLAAKWLAMSEPGGTLKISDKTAKKAVLKRYT